MVLTFGLGTVLTTLRQQVLVLWHGEMFWCGYSWDHSKLQQQILVYHGEDVWHRYNW